MPELLPVEDALRLVLEHVPPPRSELVDLPHAHLRVLAQDVAADADHPAFPRSKVDGYAHRAADAGGRLRVVCEVPAGRAPGDRVGPGEAARVFTGAKVPDGADRVAKQEDCERDGDFVRVPAAADDAHVVPTGSECARGALVGRAGDVVTPARLGALAAVGAARVAVARRPTAFVVATGDELVPVDQDPAPGRIRNSNAPALMAAAAACGARVVGTRVAQDDEAAHDAALAEALEADVALVTGGVSVGDFDLVPAALARAGVERVFHGVRVQPGKPLWFGRRGETLVFALPGNPVSALVNAALFLRPALWRRLGLRETGPGTRVARLSAAIGGARGRRRFVPVRLAPGADGVPEAAPVPFAGSGDVFGLAGADALAVVPEHSAPRAAGAAVEVVPLFGELPSGSFA